MADSKVTRTTPTEAMVWLAQDAATEIRHHKDKIWRDAAAFAVLSGFLVNIDKTNIIADAAVYQYYMLIVWIGVFMVLCRAIRILKFRQRIERVTKKWGVHFHAARDPNFKTAIDNTKQFDCVDWCSIIAGMSIYVLTAAYVAHSL